MAVEEVRAKRGTFEEEVKSQKGYMVPDEDTGGFYCIKVKSGAVTAVEGECGINDASSS